MKIREELAKLLVISCTILMLISTVIAGNGHGPGDGTGKSGNGPNDSRRPGPGDGEGPRDCSGDCVNS